MLKEEVTARLTVRGSDGLSLKITVNEPRETVGVDIGSVACDDSKVHLSLAFGNGQKRSSSAKPKTNGSSSGVMTAAELAQKDAEDLARKQADAAKKAAEKEAAEEENIKKMQAMEADGKKVSGGVHKFDASEVDVYGGEATADDLMDAFGQLPYQQIITETATKY